MICAGRLSREKKLSGIIRSWAQACKNVPEKWQLLVVGDGPERGQLGLLIDTLGLSSRVCLVGKQEQMEEWYGVSDVYLSGSFTEGLSNTLLEAMSTGLPVVSTRVSGTQTLVKANNCGVVIPIDDDCAMAEALVQIISDGNSRRLFGENGRRTIEKEYKSEAIAEAHETLYRELCSSET